MGRKQHKNVVRRTSYKKTGKLIINFLLKHWSAVDCMDIQEDVSSKRIYTVLQCPIGKYYIFEYTVDKE